MKCLACGKERKIYNCNVCKKCYNLDIRVEKIKEKNKMKNEYFKILSKKLDSHEISKEEFSKKWDEAVKRKKTKSINTTNTLIIPW